MTEKEAIEWLAEETSPTLIHIAEMKKENPMEYINEAVKVACHALEEIKQYREIGTVEEFNALKDKCVPKKPIYSDFSDNGFGKIIPYKATCSVCGHEFEFGTWNDEENHHCVCDQKMDWEGGE